MTYEVDCMERDGHRCFRCGKHVSERWPGYSCHHRQSKSVGPDTLENRIMLCGSGTTGCHGWVHSHPKMSRDEGWIVSRYAVPAEEPARHWDLGMVYVSSILVQISEREEDSGQDNANEG